MDYCAAVDLVEELCDSNSINCGDNLNQELQRIVGVCTKPVTVKSDFRIKKTHVNKELLDAIRKRDRLFGLKRLHPDNDTIAQLYDSKKAFVSARNDELRSKYELNRIQEAAGGPCTKKSFLSNQKRMKITQLPSMAPQSLTQLIPATW